MAKAKSTKTSDKPKKKAATRKKAVKASTKSAAKSTAKATTATATKKLATAAKTVKKTRKKTTRTTKRAATARKGNGKPEVVVTLTHDEIAARAYAIWVAKGRPLGLDDANWREAEAELQAERA